MERNENNKWQIFKDWEFYIMNFIHSLYDSATVQQDKKDVLGISIDTLRGKRPLSNTYRKHLQ